MTTTCLPPAAYYHINRKQTSMKPRIQEPEDPLLRDLFDELDTKVALTRDWEAAFRLTFGERAYAEAYPCIDWSSPRSEWAGDAEKFAHAFTLADSFVASVMHRLFPFQWREMIPALTHAIMAWCWRRECPVPYFVSEDDTIQFLNCAGYDNMAEWLEEQR